jgi:predicted ArsR family transcriptional regulator
MKKTIPPIKDVRTRRSIMNLLKQKGPTDSKELAEVLKLTAMAVRLHLYELQKEQLVDFQEEARPLGRPAKLWKLTSEADRIFPDAHAELNISLIEAIDHTFGEKGLNQLIQFRKKKQIEAYQSKIASSSSLKQRLLSLAKIRTEEGYMAEIEVKPNGEFLLVENHCPICTAAKACSSLCRSEVEVFRMVLGPEVHVERVEHILAGARRCAYLVRNSGG